MRLVVFGASGGVGQELVRQGIARGHQVVAVARAGSEVPEGALRHTLDVGVDPLTPALEGAAAVLSALGLKRRQVWNPWSALVSPPDFASATAGRIVAAMREAGVPRVVAVSAAGVAESAPRMNAVMRALVASSQIGVAYRDLAEMERIYAESGLAWCCPRPVTLTDGPRTGRVREVQAFGATLQISRADVAWWMLEQVERAGPEGHPQIAGA